MTDRLDVLAQREKLTEALRLESIADPGRKRIVDAMFPLPPPEPQGVTGPSGTVYKLQPFQNLSDEKWASLVANCSCLNIRVSDLTHVGALLIPGGIPGVLKAIDEEAKADPRGAVSLRFVTESGIIIHLRPSEFVAKHLDSILSRLSQKAEEP